MKIHFSFSDQLPLIKLLGFKPLIIIQMGGIQASQNTAFLYQNYQVIRQENQMKILEENKTKEQFILKELCFLNKIDYDNHFKKIRQKEKEFRNFENALKMVKLWSKEHNGVCSNIFKIYTVYEYPKVRLIEEIQARKTQNKHFEESQLLSILQSCLNAFLIDQSYSNISPHLIFIIPQGILKLISTDIADSHYQSVYNSLYYYSPQKMQNFQSIKSTSGQRQKEAAFSIGMTMLHSALLQNLAMCYEISSKRLNKKKLEHFKSKLTMIYSNSIAQLIFGLLEWQPMSRYSFLQIQTTINEICSQGHSVNSFAELGNNSNSIQFLNCDEKFLNLPIATNKKEQTISASSEANINSSDITLSSYINRVRKSEFQIICDPTIRNSLKNRDIPSQKPQSTTIVPQNSKQSIFTDTRIMNMIKEGLTKIQIATKERQVMKGIQNIKIDPMMMNTKPTPVSSSQDILSQYEFISNSKQKDCIFLVQQYEDQSRYEGMVQNGMKNGSGKLIYPDGVFYEGNFKNDTLSGKGSLYYGQNRPAYIGDWSNNKFEGFGALYNEYPVLIEGAFDYSDFNKVDDQWIKFQGNFKEDVKTGIGKIILTNGENIQAMFRQGVINGQGSFTDYNGRTIKGIWSGNKLVKLIQ